MHCLQVPFIYLQLPVAASLKQRNDPKFFVQQLYLFLKKKNRKKGRHSACRRKLAIMDSWVKLLYSGMGLAPRSNHAVVAATVHVVNRRWWKVVVTYKIKSS